MRMPTRSLVVPALLSEVAPICELVNDEALDAGFDTRTSYACQLAVGEACENIILHGYGDQKSGQIAVTVQSSPGELTIELADTAPPFNPAEHPPCPPDLDSPRLGGLGLLIMHRVMDEIDYTRRADGNTLTMRKAYLSGLDP
jgi:anti-sigma regulatory factor (Ser/Thr protein kinase)